MSAPRVPAAPPDLAGFSPVQLVGSGGYADVFLYDQHLPARRVAIKVLVAEAVAGGSSQRQFVAEANLMARVSAHPYIVTIFQADIAADGRPYLVMEYYPGPNFLQRARTERFSVADVLRAGIQLASAVETAHRMGVTHRDIKPANVLTSEFRRPGLTDFGIAAAEGPDSDESDGVSIPWSPPEAFDDDVLGPTADVYSLAATLHHLMVGRSPFEAPGGRNGPLDLMTRIQRERAPSSGRADVPVSLERALAHAMSKDPQHRPASAADLARVLQSIEAELRLSVTPLELADDGASARLIDPDDDDATRLRGVTEIEAQPAGPVISGPPTSDSTVARPRAGERRREGLLDEPAVPDTVRRPGRVAEHGAAEHGAAEADQRGPSTRLALVGGAVVAVLTVAVISLALAGGGANESVADETVVEETFNPNDFEIRAAPRPVTEMEGEPLGDGDVAFTWSAPGADDGDLFVWEQIGGVDPEAGRTPDRRIELDAVGVGDEVCVEVRVVRSGVPASAPVRECVVA